MQSFKREREMDESTNAWTDEWTDGPNGVFKPPASVENEVLPLIHSTTRMSVSSDALVSKSRREWRPARVCSPTWSIMLLAVGMAPSTRNTSQNAGLEGTAAGGSVARSAKNMRTLSKGIAARRTAAMDNANRQGGPHPCPHTRVNIHATRV